MLFFISIFRRIGIRIAALPELLDELFPLLVGRQVQERVLLFGGNDVDDVLVQPLLVLRIEFSFEILVLSLLFLGGLFCLLRIGSRAAGPVASARFRRMSALPQ